MLMRWPQVRPEGDVGTVVDDDADIVAARIAGEEMQVCIRDAAGLEHADHLLQHGRRLGEMLEDAEGIDQVEAVVGEIHAGCVHLHHATESRLSPHPAGEFLAEGAVLAEHFPRHGLEPAAWDRWSRRTLRYGIGLYPIGDDVEIDADDFVLHAEVQHLRQHLPRPISRARMPSSGLPVRR